MIRATSFRDLRLRIASAAVIAPIGLAAMWVGGIPWQALIVLLSIGMVVEWVFMVRSLRFRLMTILVSGLCYIGPTAVALIWMRGDPMVGRANVSFLVLVVWSSDIGAYVAGRILGGPKLAPLISPGKTWSGALGGLACAMMVGGIAGALSHEASVYGVVVAGVLGIASQIGDLLESALKRRTGVKDSGRLIPGHGGLLDRLDGMLMVAPLAAILALFLGRGALLWL